MQGPLRHLLASMVSGAITIVAPPQPEMLVDGPPEFPATAPLVQSTVEEVVWGFRSHEPLGGGEVFSVCVVTPLGVVISAEVTS